jgi:AraC-like DNA-binding protein
MVIRTMPAVHVDPPGPEPGKTLWRRKRPRPELAGAVLDMVGYQENGERLTGSVEMASLVVPLVIGFGAPFAIALGRRPQPGDDFASFTAGLFAGHVLIDSTGTSACIQVNFTPLGAYRFFGLPMRELSSRMVPLDDLADPEIAVLRRRLEDTANWDARLALAEDFVLDRLRRGPALDPAVASAYRELAFCHGDVRIATIASRLGWSRKHLAQRFQDEVGLPPKAIARIFRFNRLLSLACAGDSDWAGLAAECGYSDQAHLTREFAEFAGTTPTRWLAAA